MRAHLSLLSSTTDGFDPVWVEFLRRLPAPRRAHRGRRRERRILRHLRLPMDLPVARARPLLATAGGAPAPITNRPAECRQSAVGVPEVYPGRHENVRDRLDTALNGAIIRADIGGSTFQAARDGIRLGSASSYLIKYSYLFARTAGMAMRHPTAAGTRRRCCSHTLVVPADEAGSNG